MMPTCFFALLLSLISINCMIAYACSYVSDALLVDILLSFLFIHSCISSYVSDALLVDILLLFLFIHSCISMYHHISVVGIIKYLL